MAQPAKRPATRPNILLVLTDQERRVVLGEDGQPVGYDIQHASTKAPFIGNLILQQAQAAE